MGGSGTGSGERSTAVRLRSRSVLGSLLGSSCPPTAGPVVQEARRDWSGRPALAGLPSNGACLLSLARRLSPLTYMERSR